MLKSSNTFALPRKNSTTIYRATTFIQTVHIIAVEDSIITSNSMITELLYIIHHLTHHWRKLIISGSSSVYFTFLSSVSAFVSKDAPLRKPHYQTSKFSFQIQLPHLSTWLPRLLEGSGGPSSTLSAIAHCSLLLTRSRHGWNSRSIIIDSTETAWLVTVLTSCCCRFHPSTLSRSRYIVKRRLTIFSSVGPDGSVPLNLAGKNSTEGSPQVRFAAVNEQIAPIQSSLDPKVNTAAPEISNQDQAEFDQLSKSLKGTHLQERRMSHFAFEPVSLPASRVRHDHLHISMLLPMSSICILRSQLEVSSSARSRSCGKGVVRI